MDPSKMSKLNEENLNQDSTIKLFENNTIFLDIVQVGKQSRLC